MLVRDYTCLRMYLAHLDESGDAGIAAARPTTYFVLACALMHDGVWPSNLDALINLLRAMKSAAGIPTADPGSDGAATCP